MLMRARLSCCHFVFSKSLNRNYVPFLNTEPHVQETFQRDNEENADDDDGS